MYIKENLERQDSTAEEGLCVWAEIFIFVSFSSLYVLATLSSVFGKCRSVLLPYLFVSCLSRFSLLYTTIQYKNNKEDQAVLVDQEKKNIYESLFHSS